MEELFKILRESPVPTILVISGVIFLLLSVVQRIGQTEAKPGKDKLAAAIGAFLVICGIGLYLYLPKNPNGKNGDPTPTPSPQPTITKNNTPPPEVTTTGLVAYYGFEGNLTDSSGQKNYGRGFGNITYVDGVTGKAVNFDGIDNYIAIQSNKSLNPDKELTISLWIKMTSIPEGWMTILHKGGPTKSTQTQRDYSNREYALGFGSPDLLHFTSSGDNQIDQTIANVRVNSISPFSWFHYVVTVDRRNHKMKVYLNGNMEGVSDDRYNSFNNNNYDLTIGWSAEYGNLFSGSYLNGMIDDLRIYNRVLSASEISDIYKSGSN